VLILDEGVVDWQGCAVVAGEEEERGFSLRTNIKATETNLVWAGLLLGRVFGLLRRWVLGCCDG
jgi:hypothetical protein